MAERRTRSHQAPVSRRPPEPAATTLCDRCGSVYWQRTWRRSVQRTRRALLSGARGGVCPACRQAAAGEGFGRAVLQGTLVDAREEEIRRRISNVAARAAFTQPQRRVVSVSRLRDGGLEVLTTSQKLGHRIVHELAKAFGGRATYAWSDGDGRLFATWKADERPPRAGGGRT
jgi:NMD protein affecting ribosome stability and mRNA decay